MRYLNIVEQTSKQSQNFVTLFQENFLPRFINTAYRKTTKLHNINSSFHTPTISSKTNPISSFQNHFIYLNITKRISKQPQELSNTVKRTSPHNLSNQTKVVENLHLEPSATKETSNPHLSIVEVSSSKTLL